MQANLGGIISSLEGAERTINSIKPVVKSST
jgi:hypothetical protein